MVGHNGDDKLLTFTFNHHDTRKKFPLPSTIDSNCLVRSLLLNRLKDTMEVSQFRLYDFFVLCTFVT